MEYRKLKDLQKLEGNPRIIKDKEFKTLCDSIRYNPKYFEARPLILSDRTGDLVIIAGNQRYEAAKTVGLKEAPTFLIEGLTEDKEREIIIRDNISNGEFDFSILANEWGDLPLVEWGVDLPGDWLVDIPEDNEGIDETYTNKITVPIYEPKGDKPKINDLFDRQKTGKLVDEIAACDLTEDIKDFLTLAAERHTSFHFARIAEFYCHSDKKVQDLMEKSGLVIIDFKKAIENGFVHMTDKLGALADIEESENDA